MSPETFVLAQYLAAPVAVRWERWRRWERPPVKLIPELFNEPVRLPDEPLAPLTESGT